MLVYVENVVCIVSGGIEFNLSKDIKKLLRKHLKIAEHIKIFYHTQKRIFGEKGGRGSAITYKDIFRDRPACCISYPLLKLGSPGEKVDHLLLMKNSSFEKLLLT